MHDPCVHQSRSLAGANCCRSVAAGSLRSVLVFGPYCRDLESLTRGWCINQGGLGFVRSFWRSFNAFCCWLHCNIRNKACILLKDKGWRPKWTSGFTLQLILVQWSQSCKNTIICSRQAMFPGSFCKVSHGFVVLAISSVGQVLRNPWCWPWNLGPSCWVSFRIIFSFVGENLLSHRKTCFAIAGHATGGKQCLSRFAFNTLLWLFEFCNKIHNNP